MYHPRKRSTGTLRTRHFQCSVPCFIYLLQFMIARINTDENSNIATDNWDLICINFIFSISLYFSGLYRMSYTRQKNHIRFNTFRASVVKKLECLPVNSFYFFCQMKAKQVRGLHLLSLRRLVAKNREFSNPRDWTIRLSFVISRRHLTGTGVGCAIEISMKLKNGSGTLKNSTYLCI